MIPKYISDFPIHIFSPFNMIQTFQQQQQQLVFQYFPFFRFLGFWTEPPFSANLLLGNPPFMVYCSYVAWTMRCKDWGFP